MRACPPAQLLQLARVRRVAFILFGHRCDTGDSEGAVCMRHAAASAGIGMQDRRCMRMRVVAVSALLDRSVEFPSSLGWDGALTEMGRDDLPPRDPI